MIRNQFFLWSPKVSLALIFIGSIFFTPKTILPKPQVAPKVDENCTYVIPREIDEVDGSANFAKVKPGDVLCLPAGTRGNLKLINLHGVDGSPITIRNTGGKVLITGQKFIMGGIGIFNSSHIRVTGTGVTSKCGALYPSDEQDCGIEIALIRKGLTIITEGDVGHIEIDHINIHHTSTAHETRGISIHPLPGQLISDISIHHNRVAFIPAEGMYVGSAPADRPLDHVGKMENIEVSYNLVEEIGFEGMEIKVAVRNVRLHHNIVRQTGTAGQNSDSAGIKLVASVGDVYNNFIVTRCAGIKMGRLPETPGTRYFNNIVVSAQCSGIDTPENGAMVFNNTIVSSRPTGISATGVGSRIFDNIVVGTNGIPIVGNGNNMSNNFIGSVSAVGFVNPAAEDFRLLPHSPATQAGRNAEVFPNLDKNGTRRPAGACTDVEPFEFSASSSYFCPLFRFSYP